MPKISIERVTMEGSSVQVKAIRQVELDLPRKRQHEHAPFRATADVEKAHLREAERAYKIPSDFEHTTLSCTQ